MIAPQNPQNSPKPATSSNYTILATPQSATEAAGTVPIASGAPKKRVRRPYSNEFWTIGVVGAFAAAAGIAIFYLSAYASATQDQYRINALNRQLAQEKREYTLLNARRDSLRNSHRVSQKAKEMGMVPQTTPDPELPAQIAPR